MLPTSTTGPMRIAKRPDRVEVLDLEDEGRVVLLDEPLDLELVPLVNRISGTSSPYSKGLTGTRRD
jgi:hypothetical protein